MKEALKQFLESFLEKAMSTPRRNLSQLLEILDQGYKRSAWHGPNLRQSLRGVTARMAAWRPNPGRHNIWEITVHAAYWKYVVRRRLNGEKRRSFLLKGSNWFARPEEISERAWQTDLALLEAEHNLLRAAVVDYLAGKTRPIPARLIYGAALHDIYHAGQIRLLRQLQSKKNH